MSWGNDVIKLVIDRKLLENLVKQCVDYPFEKVFIGIGKVEEGVYSVEYVNECRNIALEPLSRFVADPQCILDTYRLAEERGKEITTLIHSHPAPPKPSSEDRKGMWLWRIPWIIINSYSGEYKAWIIHNESLEEVYIEFIQ
uniref:JAB domain-containing protein n=1 Tax=Ignisphaera aggregans TaxID=334771 RepID=A0A832A8X2_9CREN